MIFDDLVRSILKEDIEEQQIDHVQVNLKHIPDDVLLAIKAFFKGHPKDFDIEHEASGIDPIAHPLEYFKYELREHEHEDIRNRVNRSGTFNMEDFNDWKREEREEELINSEF